MTIYRERIMELLFVFLCCLCFPLAASLSTTATANNSAAEMNWWFSPQRVLLQPIWETDVALIFSDALPTEETVRFAYVIGSEPQPFQDAEIIQSLNDVTIPAGNSSTVLRIVGVNVGTVYVLVNSSNNLKHLANVELFVAVVHSIGLDVLAQIVGWIYWASWAVANFTQVFHNCRRKSVVGLHFDYLVYCFAGSVAYAFYNFAMLYIPEIERQYQAIHPRGVQPVLLNDVLMSFSHTSAAFLMLFQCCIYERGGQHVSLFCTLLTTIGVLLLFILLVLASQSLITWLSFVYALANYQVVNVPIRYISQAWFNFRRKSTTGWSIGLVLFDLIGGVGSVLQMVFNAANGDDWGSLGGNSTKLFLGLFTILVSCIFIIQHCIVYRGKEAYSTIGDESMSPKPKKDREEEASPTGSK